MSYALVIDRNQNPLMPCHPARARQLLTKKKAKVFKMQPFTIILTQRASEQSSIPQIGGAVQPIECKIDPGSKTTGIALVVQGKNQRKAIWGAHLMHKGHKIKQAFDCAKRNPPEKRKAIRRHRRSRLTRYRPPRFNNRVRPQGWLPPSLLSCINNIYNWVRKLKLWTPINCAKRNSPSSIELEHVNFDIQKLKNPEIKGIVYQQGTLVGYEIREYLLEKWNRKCAYCDKTNVRFEIDHVIPKSKGGTNRISNLVLACKSCNNKKGTLKLEDFVKDEKRRLFIKAHTKASYKGAGIMNSIRTALVSSLESLGDCAETGASLPFRNRKIPVHLWSGALTKLNRVTQNYEKQHWIDAVCVGESGAKVWIRCLRDCVSNQKPLTITATGRGSRQKCQMDSKGFPKTQPKKAKIVHGLQSGDLVKVVKPKTFRSTTETPKWLKLLHKIGRVSIRATGSFDLTTLTGEKATISYKCCKIVQKFNGYSYFY